MKFNDLIERWQRSSDERRLATVHGVRLPLRDAARLSALATMYPGRGEDEILADLVGAALDELERSLPYLPGERVVAEDEYGDPIYEDIGLTPRFSDLTRRFARELEAGGTGE